MESYYVMFLLNKHKKMLRRSFSSERTPTVKTAVHFIFLHLFLEWKNTCEGDKKKENSENSDKSTLLTCIPMQQSKFHFFYLI